MEAVFEDGDEGGVVIVCCEEVVVAVLGGGFCFEEEDWCFGGHFGRYCESNWVWWRVGDDVRDVIGADLGCGAFGGLSDYILSLLDWDRFRIYSCYCQ